MELLLFQAQAVELEVLGTTDLELLSLVQQVDQVVAQEKVQPLLVALET
jgi:hypothetical protein